MSDREASISVWNFSQSAFLRLKEGGEVLIEGRIKGTEMEIGRWSEPRGGKVCQEMRSTIAEGARERSGEEKVPPEEVEERVKEKGSLRRERGERSIQSAMELPRGSAATKESHWG